MTQTSQSFGVVEQQNAVATFMTSGVLNAGTELCSGCKRIFWSGSSPR